MRIWGQIVTYHSHSAEYVNSYIYAAIPLHPACSVCLQLMKTIVKIQIRHRGNIVQSSHTCTAYQDKKQGYRLRVLVAGHINVSTHRHQTSKMTMHALQTLC